MEYKIITEITISGIIEQVNKEMKKGWIPVGGVEIYQKTENFHIYHQSVTRQIAGNKKVSKNDKGSVGVESDKRKASELEA